jgi:hypothetical protein
LLYGNPPACVMAAVDDAIGKFPKHNGGIWPLQLRGNIYLEFLYLAP